MTEDRERFIHEGEAMNDDEAPPMNVEAELFRLSAQLMALETLLMALLDRMPTDNLDRRSFVAGVFGDAERLIGRVAELSGGDPVKEVHHARILGYLRAMRGPT